MTRIHSGFTGTVARVGGAGATVEAAARWIRSDRERPVTLELSTSGLAARIHLTVWLNGRVVYQDDLTTDPQRKPTGKVAVNAILRAGENTLVVKSNLCNWQWQFPRISVGPTEMIWPTSAMPRSRNHLPPFTPCSRALNMGTVQTDGLTHAQRARISSTC